MQDEIATKDKKFKKKDNMIFKLTWFYGMMTFVVLVITYYMPFRMQKAGISDFILGEVTALYFLAMAIPGFMLSTIIFLFRRHAILIGNILLIAGIIVNTIFSDSITFAVGAAFMCFGYGIIQPILYDKATNTTDNDKESTQRFSILLYGNYIAIALGPFIFKIIEDLIHDHSLMVPYYISIIVMVVIILLNIFYRNSFVFSTKEYMK